MAESVAWLGGVFFLAMLVTGCLTPEASPLIPEQEGQAHGGNERIPNRDGDGSSAGSDTGWDQISASECTVARIIIGSHQAVFPFATPKHWPGPRQQQLLSFDLQVYTCQTLLLGTEYVFHNVSFAFETHDNLSWRENPDFDSNALEELLGFYVQNGTLANQLEAAGLTITRAQVTISGDLDSLVARIENNRTSISLALEGVESISDKLTSIVHIVPPQSEGNLLRFSLVHASQHSYAPWKLDATGDSATARMGRALEAQIPSLQGYAAKGSLDIVWEADFA